jgi:hypothetical protein
MERILAANLAQLGFDLTGSERLRHDLRKSPMSSSRARQMEVALGQNRDAGQMQVDASRSFGTQPAALACATRIGI